MPTNVTTIIGDIATDIPEVIAAINGAEAAIAAYGKIPDGSKKISDIATLATALLAAIAPLGDAIQVETGLKL